MSKALGIDLGTVRTGIAVEVLGIAQPFKVLTVLDEELVREIAAVGAEEGATEFVVGHPLRLDGTEGEAALRTREMADALRAATGKPVVLWDERLTTAQAERSLVGAGVRRRKRRSVVDEVAATVMLQSYLDAGRGKR